MVNRKNQTNNDELIKSRYGVLTDVEIHERLERKTEHPSSLIITPCPQKIDRDSIDLRLGSYFFVPRSHRSPCFVPGLTSPDHLYSEQYVPMGSYLVLPAHHTVLGSTFEYIKLPSDVSGEILNKSSWARTFVTIETAPWIHPLYRGCLTLEIANVSNTPVILYPGVRIAQLVLLKTMFDPAEDEIDKVEGTYVGPVRPEPAQLPTPEKALVSIGINEHDVVYPFDECMEKKDFSKHIVYLLKKQGSFDEYLDNEDFMKHITELLRKRGFTVEQKGE